MKQSLQLRTSQHLALTPQLQQSIRLLQLSTLELHQELDQLLSDNPMLERLDDPQDFAVRLLADGSINGAASLSMPIEVGIQGAADGAGEQNSGANADSNAGDTVGVGADADTAAAENAGDAQDGMLDFGNTGSAASSDDANARHRQCAARPRAGRDRDRGARRKWLSGRAAR